MVRISLRNVKNVSGIKKEMNNEKIAKKLIACFKRGNFCFVIGNGGSASEANHFAGEMVNRFFHDRRALPMLSLCADNAVMTSIANDYGFENIFSRQLEAFGRKGDVLITLSTSGGSANIQKANEMAQKLGIEIISFPTNHETKMDTPHTQGVHLDMLHDISKLVEEAFLE